MNIDFSEQIADEAASPSPEKIDDITESRNDSIIPFEANCFSPEKEDQISFEVSLKNSPPKIALIDQEIQTEKDLELVEKEEQKATIQL